MRFFTSQPLVSIKLNVFLLTLSMFSAYESALIVWLLAQHKQDAVQWNFQGLFTYLYVTQVRQTKILCFPTKRTRKTSRRRCVKLKTKNSQTLINKKWPTLLLWSLNCSKILLQCTILKRSNHFHQLEINEIFFWN